LATPAARGWSNVSCTITTVGAVFDSPPATGVAEPLFLGSAPATRKDYSRALGVAAALLAAFAVTAPFAERRLFAVPAFVPAYNAAVLVLDLITGLLLHAQFRQLKERSFLALACGYLFTPIVMLAHALAFPDAFVRGTLIGGAQTTAWLWNGWHGVFPCFLAAYGVLARGDRERVAPLTEEDARRWSTLAVSGTLLLAAAIAAAGIGADRFLPPLMSGSEYRALSTRLVLSTCWSVHVVALVLLVWSTRLRRLIDVWIGVTLLAWMIDLALSAVLITGRYQLGFYLGRVYGLFGNVFVLVILLRELVALYAGAEARVRERTAQLAATNDSLQLEIRERRVAEDRARGLLNQLITAQEQERRRIARDIHDDVGQQITALRLCLQTLPPGEAERARQMAEELDRAIDALAWELRPAMLEDLGLAAALEQFVNQWSDRVGIVAAFDTVATSTRRLSGEVEINVYRIAQEALHNIAKHAGATRVSVALTRRDDCLVLIVEDNGRGFAPPSDRPAAPAGLGLLTIRERATLLGGDVDIESSPASGTSVYVRVPLMPTR
jgi:signal transduction histidine kinase